MTASRLFAPAWKTASAASCWARLGCDICYTNHAEADQDDMDTLNLLLVPDGLNFLMGVPGADDVMLN
jgi:ethanolamine ammonia-lyase large subunit